MIWPRNGGVSLAVFSRWQPSREPLECRCRDFQTRLERREKDVHHKHDCCGTDRGSACAFARARPGSDEHMDDRAAWNCRFIPGRAYWKPDMAPAEWELPSSSGNRPLGYWRDFTAAAVENGASPTCITGSCV